GGTECAGVQHVNGIDVFRIGKDMSEIPGALRKTLVVVDLRPGCAVIFRTQDAAFFRFDQRIDARRVCRHRDTDAAKNSVGKTVTFKVRPGGATIGRFIKTAAGPTAAHVPRLTYNLPHGGIQSIWVRGIELNVDGPRLVIFVENFLPGLTAIQGAEDAALRVRAKRVTESGNEHAVGILRIDDHAADLAGVFQTKMLPALPGIYRSIHAVPVGDVAANAGFTRSNIDHVVVATGNRKRAHGSNSLFIGDRLPCAARVDGLPHAARHRAKIKRRWIARHAAHGKRTSAAERPYLTPLHCAESLFGILLGWENKAENREEEEKREPITRACFHSDSHPVN